MKEKEASLTEKFAAFVEAMDWEPTVKGTMSMLREVLSRLQQDNPSEAHVIMLNDGPQAVVYNATDEEAQRILEVEKTAYEQKHPHRQPGPFFWHIKTAPLR